MNFDWQTGKVIEIIKESHNTNRYIIEAPHEQAFDFMPGQFVTLDLPIHEKKNKRLRSYSISSAPNNTNRFELLISLVEDGLGTPYLFNHIKPGYTIQYRGPVGVFILPSFIESDLFLICTGTGIAPFRSMVHSLFEKKATIQNIYLIVGTRTQKDLLYHQELLALQNTMKNFHYIPVLSREQWEGESGYVHKVYQPLVRQNHKAQFMLCGWKNMIDDARKILESEGFDKKQIHFELYG